MSANLPDFVRSVTGYNPSDAKLFERAFTHSSLARDSYERLEFLGDRVLGLFIAEALYGRYPDEPEGQLSRRYNALVTRETCAGVGRAIGVPAMIRVGRQARDDHANYNDNIVGDVVEALIGALLIDGGLEVAKSFVLSQWGEALDNQGRAPQHPKSALQELAAARGLQAPVYELVGRTGTHHTPRFTVKVSIARLGEAEAEGASKQEAETAAALAMLERMR